jgi:valyl-tRNA synthetase
LEGIVKMLHPFAPFITEEIYQRIQKAKGKKEIKSIMKENWEKPQEKFLNYQEDEKVETIFSIVRGIRNLRHELNIPFSQKVEIYLKGEKTLSIINENRDYIMFLAKVEKLNFSEVEIKNSLSYRTDSFEIYLPLKEEEIQKEKNRIEKEISNLKKELEILKKRLQDEKFLKRAPEEIVEKEKNKEREISNKLKELNQRLEKLNV